MVDFDDEILKHLQWRTMVEGLFHNTEQASFISSSILIQDNKCQLGKWIYSEESNSYSTNRIFKQLLDSHKEFHLKAGTILRLCQEGKVDVAKLLEDGFYILSGEVIKCLEALKSQEAGDPEPQKTETISNLKKIVWTDDFSVEIPILDKHHKTIIRIINELIDKPDIDVASEKYHEYLQELMDYTIYHLRYEEELMENSGYPKSDYRDHVDEHDAFIEKISQFIAEASDKIPDAPLVLIRFLRYWIEHHILVVDKQYAAHLYKFLYGEK